MSGHSHWHGIRHKKALTDAKKANIFTKFGKLITIAAREGGGDPSTNVKLRLIADQARRANMPKDNIEKAIKRGTGELKSKNDIQEVIYEAYGPGNVAMMIKTATDNKNRTVSEIKTVFNKLGGQMVPEGSVGYLFQPVGILTVAQSDVDDEECFELEAIDTGAIDIQKEGSDFLILTDPKNLKTVQEHLAKSGISISGSSLGFWPQQKLSIDEEARKKYDELLEQLDEQEDVQEIYDNL